MADLGARGAQFRMEGRSDSELIQIVEYKDGKRLRRFSSEVYKKTEDEDIETLHRLCVRASESGTWEAVIGGTTTDEKMTWAEFANRVKANLVARVARESSRRDTQGHLKEHISKFRGEVTSKRLFKWACEEDPVTRFYPFKKRIETLAQIQASGLLDVQKEIAELKKMKPKGSAKKRQERLTEKPRAIPKDLELEKWLDEIEDDLVQWVFALIATYGLRPSEAWHAEEIDEKGWITVPGDGLTKTELHYSPPVPREWVDRYKLRENFREMSERLNDRWKIRWEERDGVSIPVNNSQVSNSLWRNVYRTTGNVTKKLFAAAADGEGQDWVRPYDLRHSFAIRCFDSEEVRDYPTEEFAQWMGHGVEVHKRTYLKWMPAARRKQAVQGRFDHFGAKEKAPIEEAREETFELPADILKKLQKLEKLEKLMGDED